MNIEGRLSVMDAWPEWEQKIVTYAKMDSAFRPAVREILKQLDSEQKDMIFPEGANELFTIEYQFFV